MNTFEQNIGGIVEKIGLLKDQILTEEATKSAFIMPMLQLLGYDVFNPLEVVPEFIADQSTKKDEKVDYCIKKNGEPIIIIECKHWSKNLDLHGTQLERYFAFTNARFGILTNGIHYRFYTDLIDKNKMDTKPFLEFDLEKLRESVHSDILKFHKTNFDADVIFNSAGQLKYAKEIRSIFDQELKDPTPEFVRFFAGQVFEGRLVEKVMAEFTGIVKKAINQSINETISERLHKAINQNVKEEEAPETREEDPAKVILFRDEERGIVTTKEEMDGFEVVVDILSDVLPPERIANRDTKSYFGILLDDNNRKPLCRLYLEGSKKYIGLFDEDKNEERQAIEKVEHIYKYASQIVETAERYLVAMGEID